MNSAADIWAKVLSLMEGDLTPTAINTWFDDSVAVELTDSSFVIYTPTAFKQQIISARYLPYIKKALKELFAADMGVTVLCENQLEERNLQQNKENRNILIGSNDFTFESFVVGSSNRFAYNAAQAVSMKPAYTYNPLLIYGQSGLGKTHLLYAIANQARLNFPGFRICYVNGETFTIDMIKALRQSAMDEFRAKYRECDLLLMDDVQFIAGKESTQEEFFHTFNTLYQAKKQIVLTSDRPPNEMVRLEDRLRTRFEQGLIADIQPPDYETRIAIVQKKAVNMGLPLPESVVEYIAENITSNVRQLEGTVRKILAYQDLLNTKLDIDTVIRAIRDLIREKDEFVPSPDEIIEDTAKFFGLDPKDIKGSSRTKEINQARQISMYLIRHITSLSLKEIGQIFDRDHTTVMHALDKVAKMIDEDRKISEIIKDINANINARNY